MTSINIAAKKAAQSLTGPELEKLMRKPLVQTTDMPPEMGIEAVEIVTLVMDKFLASKNYEGAAQMLKNAMDKKFGTSWQCAIGEGFGFDITCQKKFLLYVFYGKVGVLCYKCA